MKEDIFQNKCNVKIDFSYFLNLKNVQLICLRINHKPIHKDLTIKNLFSATLQAIEDKESEGHVPERAQGLEQKRDAREADRLFCPDPKKGLLGPYSKSLSNLPLTATLSNLFSVIHTNIY